MRNRKKPHRLILYSISPCQRIFENFELGRPEGKHNEEQGNGAKRYNSPFWRLANQFVFVQQPSLVKIRDCGRNKENGDVEPIGSLADHSVIGVKENRNQDDPKKNSTKLDTPKILAITEEKALYNSKNKHRHKEKLHVLPRRFVHARNWSDPRSLSKPII